MACRGLCYRQAVRHAKTLQGFAQSDQRTDIYSLGVTLNEVAVGKLPEDKICGGKLGVVIRRCIEFDPKRRYQNAAQALKHIDWLEKRTAVIVISAIVLCAVILLLSILICTKPVRSAFRCGEPISVKGSAVDVLANFALFGTE